MRAFANLLEGDGTYARALSDLDASDVSSQRVNLVNRRLVRAVDRDAMSSGDAGRVMRDVRDAASNGRDVTELFEDDAMAEALVRTYDASSAGSGTLRAIDDLDAAERQKIPALIDETGDAGAALVGDLDQPSLKEFVEVDFQDADMAAWRRAMARLSDSGSAVESDDVASYAQDLRAVQRLDGSDEATITNPNRLVQEVIEGPDQDGQVLGQMFEAQRTRHYAETYDSVTVDPNTPGTQKPDLHVSRSSADDIYAEQKMVEGNLENGLKVKDKVMEADGSFDGISSDADQVVEIRAQDEVTDDFNPITADPETPKESFIKLIREERRSGEIEDLPPTLSGVENPDIRVRVLDADGNVIEGGEFTLSEAYAAA